MSEELAPLSTPNTEITALQDWSEPNGPGPTPATVSPLERAWAAIRRYKFLVFAIIVLATGLGFAATRLVVPQYEVSAKIWIQTETPLSDREGPIHSAELLNSDAWVELLKSYKVSDEVVRELNLYVSPAKLSDAPLFDGFALGDRFIAGSYQLILDRTRKRWTLTSASYATVDSGAAADSVGGRFGLHWKLPPTAFDGSGQRTVAFGVSTPRETAAAMQARLSTHLPPQSNFLSLTLQDRDPKRAALTLNTWADDFVRVAGELKKRDLVEVSNILNGQLSYAEGTLHDAETALQDFKIHTITLPTEGGPVAAGVEETRDPALSAFFRQKADYDDVRHDREALEKTIQAATAGTTPWESVLFIPSVAQSPAAGTLQASFKEAYDEQAKLTAERQLYTDAYGPVKQMVATLNVLQTQTIPNQVKQVLAQLIEREGQYDERIRSQSQDLQAIPTRTIEEMRLRRAVTVAEGLYTTLKTRYAEAQLAEASSVPDVNVLDRAIAPVLPTTNTKPEIMLFAIAAGIGMGLGLALVLDRLDARVQYAEQASTDLGLPIAGAVPRLPRGGVNLKAPEQVYQLVESFRSLRMSVSSSARPPFALAVSSPSPADGKSFISANLAMSFAEGGFKTLLIDGDTRRGTLNDMFSLRRTPGLTDFLAGAAERSTIIHSTPYQNLSLMPSGTRRRKSPEYLTSPALKELIESLRSEYEVIICDTPPFAAGIDAYALAVAAERLVVVLRVGRTRRKMAAAKLVLLDRLPVEVVGTVLNSVQLDGEFQYYGYVRGYEAHDEDMDEPRALLQS